MFWTAFEGLSRLFDASLVSSYTHLLYNHKLVIFPLFHVFSLFAVPSDSHIRDAAILEI